jgi:hypothetical protein
MKEKKEVLYVYLDTDTANKIREKAKESSIPVSSWIRMKLKKLF